MLLARLLTLASGGLLGLRPGRAAAEPPPEISRIRMIRQSPGSATRPSTSQRSSCGPRGFPKSNTSSRESTVAVSPAWPPARGTSASTSPRADHPGRQGRSRRHAGGGPRRLLRADRQRFGPVDQGPARASGWRSQLGPALTSSSSRWWRTWGWTRGRTSIRGPSPGRGEAPPRRGQGRRVPGLPSRASGASGEEGRPRGREQRRPTGHGPSTSAAWSRRTGSSCGRHPVATKRALRAILKSVNVCAVEPAGVARMLVDRGFTPNFDYAQDAMKDIPYGQVARLQPGGHGAFLRAPAPGGRHDPVEPAEDPRPGHRLATLPGAQARAQGMKEVSMSDRRESWSRRRFVSGLTLAGTAGLAGVRPAPGAAEPPPETTRLRLLKEMGRTAGPRSTSPRTSSGRRVHRRDLRGFSRRRGVGVPRGGEGGHQPALRRAQHHPAGPGGSRRVPGRRARGVFRGHRHGAGETAHRSQGQDRGRPRSPGRRVLLSSPASRPTSA